MRLFVLKQEDDEYVVDRLEMGNTFVDCPIIYLMYDDVFDQLTEFKETTGQDAYIRDFDFDDLKEFEHIKVYSTAGSIYEYMPKYDLFNFLKALEQS